MITTLTGTNSFLIDDALTKRLNEFKSENSELAIEQLDGQEDDYQRIYDALNNLPFLSPKKLIIIKNSGANKEFVQSAEKAINDLPDSNELVIVEPNIDKRSTFYKLLKSKTDYQEFGELSSGELASWLVTQAKAKGGELSISDANYLINIAGTNQIRLYNELQKLSAYKNRVTQSEIDLLVDPIPQTTIFQLLDAVFVGNGERALKIYDDQRLQRVEPQQIIAMLTWQLHILALIKTAKGRSASEIAKGSGLNPFVVNKSYAIANRLTIRDLRSIIEDVTKLDIDMKSRMIDADDAMKCLLVSTAETSVNN